MKINFLDYLKKIKIKLIIFLGILGPGVITAVSDNDSAGVATYALFGASFGYSVLFILIIITFISSVIQEISARAGVVSNQGLGAYIRERYGIRLALLVFLGVFIINFSTVITNFYGLLNALEILRLPKSLLILTFIIGSIIFILKGNYQTFEKFFLLLIFFYFAYVVSAFKTSVDWGLAFKSLFFPTNINLNRDFVFGCLAALGTTLTPWELFLIGRTYIDKKIESSKLKYTQLETHFGVFLTSFFLFFIIITTAASLYVNKIPLKTGEAAALAIKPFAGEFASLLFAIGLLNASIMGIWMVSLSNSYLFSDMFGFEGSLDAPYYRGKNFYTVFIFQIILGGILTLIPNLSLFKIVFYTQSLNAIFLPVVIFFLLKIANNKEIMGSYKNTKITNYLAYFCFALILISTIFTIFSSFFN